MAPPKTLEDLIGPLPDTRDETPLLKDGVARWWLRRWPHLVPVRMRGRVSTYGDFRRLIKECFALSPAQAANPNYNEHLNPLARIAIQEECTASLSLLHELFSNIMNWRIKELRYDKSGCQGFYSSDNILDLALEKDCRRSAAWLIAHGGGQGKHLPLYNFCSCYSSGEKQAMPEDLILLEGMLQHGANLNQVSWGDLLKVAVGWPEAFPILAAYGADIYKKGEVNEAYRTDNGYENSRRIIVSPYALLQKHRPDLVPAVLAAHAEHIHSLSPLKNWQDRLHRQSNHPVPGIASP